jgi:hypothetical protein
MGPSCSCREDRNNHATTTSAARTADVVAKGFIALFRNATRAHSHAGRAAFRMIGFAVAQQAARM